MILPVAQGVLDWFPVIVGGCIVGGFLALIIGFWWGMGPEGRWFMGRHFKGGGLDVLIFNKDSKRLEPKQVMWSGNYWYDKNAEGLYFGLDLLMDPATTAQIEYNKAMSAACNWDGCGRPVVTCSSEMCFMFTPEVGAILTKSKYFPQATEEDKTKYKALKSAAEKLEVMLQGGLQSVTIVQPVELDVLKNMMDGATPKAMRQAHEIGKTAGILSMTRPSNPFNISKWHIIGILLIIGVLILGVFLWQSGALNGIMGTTTPGGTTVTKWGLWFANRLR